MMLWKDDVQADGRLIGVVKFHRIGSVVGLVKREHLCYGYEISSTKFTLIAGLLRTSRDECEQTRSDCYRCNGVYIRLTNSILPFDIRDCRTYASLKVPYREPQQWVKVNGFAGAISTEYKHVWINVYQTRNVPSTST
ncbi:hypothetical protein CSKR_109175 [Clonorchis sinensis]|uniref:Uncharacterized protein n=2 Tax=Clonorchis sinensis TaxID=79923 RepID=G7YKS2_CLOSI|nr:hypothetical protein CSKR_109175 [Clonorchis sinensis]GAA53553.1 hypothetical protein CLF_110481 [Clonorchis sinensis]